VILQRPHSQNFSAMLALLGADLTTFPTMGPLPNSLPRTNADQEALDRAEEKRRRKAERKASAFPNRTNPTGPARANQKEGS